MITCVNTNTACRLSVCEFCNPTNTTDRFLYIYTLSGTIVVKPNPDFKAGA